FQAEDGIRDFHVTGVQTCALPIFCRRDCEAGDALLPADMVAHPARRRSLRDPAYPARAGLRRLAASAVSAGHLRKWRRSYCRSRSEERRVGKEGRSRGGAVDKKTE